MKNAIYMLSLTLAICSCSSKAKNQTETTKANLENPESASITKIDFAKEFSKKDLEAKKNIQIFQDGYKLLQDKKWDESISAFQKQLLVKNNLEEYSRFYLAQAYFEKSEWELSKSELEKVLKLSPNVKMQLDANNLLGEISLQKKNYKEAKNYLQKIEKRTRNTESYQQTIYNLAAAEKGLKNFRQMCRWLTKIYIQYPNFEKTQDWGADLSSNLFMNEPTRCKTEISDFRSRMKSLLRSGLDKKAQVEIDSLKKNLMKSDPYIADQIQAQFYLQEGEVQKTLDILKPYREEKKYDFSYLMQLAVAAARIGDVQLSVSTYYSAYRLSPGSKLARQALYQSAFLSYQFQDYEGATKRFQEFIKVYRNSSLVKDVQWHLAWLKYLQKDYTGSYKSFAELLQKKSSRRKNARVAPPDRINYWMAMSLFRQGKYEPAKAIFEKLSKDKLLGYYSVAAQSRLDKIALLIPLQQAEKNKQDENKIIYHSNLPTQPLVISRFSASEFLLPSIDDGFSSDGNIESEEDYVISELDQQDQESTDTADLENGTEQDSVEVAENETVSFSSPVLMARFERARDLMIAGFDEWARWDLYDIERKTSNREYLRTLMNEYSTIKHFHRSSYIAQTYFSQQRAHFGLSGVRYLWDFAYPKAYAEKVEQAVKKFSVPEELVWGIMRAESQYRRDAISPVGALGLMQVMPYTGQRIAKLLNDTSFQTQQLLQPETAIKMGTFYLKRLMNKFDNSTPLVAAGYNAGPHRVKNWLISFGHLDMDEFIDHIPFLETRNYVKKVVANTHVYGQMYKDKKNQWTFLSNPISVKPDANLVTKESWDEI